MLNYDQKKDINKSETLSIKCVLRLEEKNSFVISPNVKSSTPVIFLHVDYLVWSTVPDEIFPN